MAGIARGKIMPAEKFAADEGMRLPESIFLQTVTGDYPADTLAAMSPAEIDIVLKADARTVRVVPWAAEPTAQVIHDCFYSDGRRVTMAPRACAAACAGTLRAARLGAGGGAGARVLSRRAEHRCGLSAEAADRPLRPRRAGPPELQHRGRQRVRSAVRRHLRTTAKAQDIEIDTLIHEDGPAQMEINLLHGDPLDLADQAFLFKRTAREAALRHKMYATFMAKPHAKEPGSAMHIHQSIVDKQDAARTSSRNPDGTPSQLFFAHIAGLQKYLPAAMALFAPNVNSYRRITRSSAGADQRAVGLRQPHGRPARAGVGSGEPPRREPRRRRRRESLSGHRGLAGLRLSRHGREPAAHRTRSPAAPTSCRSRCRARSTARCAGLRECEPLIGMLGEPFVARSTIVQDGRVRSVPAGDQLLGARASAAERLSTGTGASMDDSDRFRRLAAAGRRAFPASVHGSRQIGERGHARHHARRRRLPLRRRGPASSSTACRACGAWPWATAARNWPRWPPGR